jgi:hypothetical protein
MKSARVAYPHQSVWNLRAAMRAGYENEWSRSV